MADSGGSYSVSPGTEMLMDIVMPMIQGALDAGIRPTLSIDAETNVPTTMFTQMQLCLAAQRIVLTQRKAAGEKGRAEDDHGARRDRVCDHRRAPRPAALAARRAR